jgi:hypothetical protein
MLSTLLSLTLVLSPTNLLGRVYEEIRLSDSLTLRAEYLPEGETTAREGMFLTVEDFVIIQTELEFSGTACDARTDALRAQHLTFVGELQQRCRAEYEMLAMDLEKAEATILVRELERDSALSEKAIYRWATVGLSVVVLGTGSYILLSR